MPLIVLVWVVRRWLQIVLADASVGGGFFNGLLINQLDAQIVLAHEDEMDMLFANGGEDSIAMGSH